MPVHFGQSFSGFLGLFLAWLGTPEFRETLLSVFHNCKEMDDFILLTNA